MGDGPTKVDGVSIGGSIEIKYGGDCDIKWGEMPVGPEPKYYGKGSCNDFFICPDLFLPCPEYIFPFPHLFGDKPLPKIQYFKVKSEEEAANERVAGFINDRAGKTVIPVSDADSIEVSKGKAKDGEIKIRVVTKSLFDEAPKVRLFVVKANGTIYEEDLEENRVKIGEMSREDASALIASLYGKKELGRNPVPSDKHIESVTKDINGEDDIDIFSIKDLPFNVPYLPNYPWHEDEGPSNFSSNDNLSGIRIYFIFD